MSEARAIVVGIVALVLSFPVLRLAGELCAILIRRRWPDAWFSGLIVWYSLFFAAGCSVAIAVYVGWSASKRQQNSAGAGLGRAVREDKVSGRATMFCGAVVYTKYAGA